MSIFNGIDDKTIKNMQLDAGVIVEGVLNPEGDEDTFLQAIKAGSLGATKGATTFSAIPEIRNIFEGIDGVRGDIKNGNVIDKWEVTLKASVTAFTLKNLSISLGATTEASHSKYDTIEPSDEILNEKYKSISWVGTVASGKDPIVITLNNCLNMNGLTITAEDKNTGLIEIELRAHIDLKAPETKQFKIFLPKNAQLPSRKAEIKELDK